MRFPNHATLGREGRRESPAIGRAAGGSKSGTAAQQRAPTEANHLPPPGSLLAQLTVVRALFRLWIAALDEACEIFHKVLASHPHFSQSAIRFDKK